MSQLSIFTTCCYLQIMGLNPPFGFKASLANQFINKALTFKPKLIILIVPKETERCPLLLSICMFFAASLYLIPFHALYWIDWTKSTHHTS